MNLEQAAAIAELEREWGAARVVALGPRRDRILKWADDDAIAVAISEVGCGMPAFAVQPDGTYEQEEARA